MDSSPYLTARLAGKLRTARRLLASAPTCRQRGATQSAETAPRRQCHPTVLQVTRVIRCGETVPSANGAGTTGKVHPCHQHSLARDGMQPYPLTLKPENVRKKASFFVFLKNLLFIKKLTMPSETGYRKYDP